VDRVLKATDLHKTYAGREVVSGVNLEVHSGQVIGLLGPNGAGKTTSFYMVVGLARPDQGRVFLDDQDITDLPMYRRARLGISYLPQEASVFRKLTVADNLLAIIETLKLTKGEQKQRLEMLLDDLNIGHIADSKGYALSGGERRRVEIARSLVLEPAFLLLDEPFAKNPKGIRDIAQWYMTVVEEPEFVQELFERQSEIAIQNMQRLNAIAGDVIDVVVVCGTDFGTQDSTFCSAGTYDDIWQPYYKKMNDWIHANTKWKTFKHSCGAVESFMSHFIDSGHDIINPVQCSAAGMDPQTLKDRYGDKITFWGGGVNTQQTLPFGTPEETRAEVLERCRIFSPNGGFIFNAVHNVQALSPIENVVAMIDAVAEFNGRG